MKWTEKLSIINAKYIGRKNVVNVRSLPFENAVLKPERAVLNVSMNEYASEHCQER